MLACTRRALHKGKDMREVKRFSVGVDGVDPNGNLVRYVDYAALQQKLDAVLAENVVLKGFIDEDCYTLGEAWSSNGQVTDAAQSVPETPATDALLNAVRAEAIEQAAEKRHGFIVTKWAGALRPSRKSN